MCLRDIEIKLLIVLLFLLFALLLNFFLKRIYTLYFYFCLSTFEVGYQYFYLSIK